MKRGLKKKEPSGLGRKVLWHCGRPRGKTPVLQKDTIPERKTKQPGTLHKEKEKNVKMEKSRVRRSGEAASGLSSRVIEK